MAAQSPFEAAVPENVMAASRRTRGGILPRCELPLVPYHGRYLAAVGTDTVPGQKTELMP